ncbi:hypothetical protein BVX94_03015 [bacterium B17]|nr:hypothetical protein BVX94_03015 [bacterium B17]
MKRLAQFSFAVVLASVLLGQISLADDVVKVTADNYVRAETDFQISTYVKNTGCFGKFIHSRKPYDVHNQVTVRSNRDTLYSYGVFDLTSPVTIRLPDPQGRYQSLMLISQDHSIAAAYSPKKLKLTRKKVGTRYAFLAIRTFMDPNNEDDVKLAHQLQDQVIVEQDDMGKFEVPNWDQKGIETLRAALDVLSSTMTDTSTYFGDKKKLNPIHHMMGAAAGWGGLPREDAVYSVLFPPKNDGKTAYTLTLKDVPVDAFWSVTLYDAEGWMPVNKYNAYSFNSVTAERNADDSVTIHFGGDPKNPNYFPLVKGWNYNVRQYRPRKEILDGSWTVPELVEVK